MNKKAQAALEFLVTYGWAFLAIVITISALYYFGIFNFAKYLPQKCTFPSQFKCIDFTMNYDAGTIKFRLLNDIEEDLFIEDLQITNDAASPLSCTSPTNLGDWAYGEERDFEFTACQNGVFLKGERIEAKITLTYHAVNTPSTPQHTVKGKIAGAVG